MKKFILTLLILSMLMGLVACKPKEKDELKLGFVPLVDQDKLEDMTEPLTKILTDKLGTKVSMFTSCLLYTSPSPRDRQKSRMPSSA